MNNGNVSTGSGRMIAETLAIKDYFIYVGAEKIRIYKH